MCGSAESLYYMPETNMLLYVSDPGIREVVLSPSSPPQALPGQTWCLPPLLLCQTLPQKSSTAAARFGAKVGIWSTTSSTPTTAHTALPIPSPAHFWPITVIPGKCHRGCR